MATTFSLQDISSTDIRRGRRVAGRDEALSRLGVEFAGLNAALLSGIFPPGLTTQGSVLDLWLTVIKDALPIRAKTATGRRVKAVMLLAIIQQNFDSNDLLRDMARSIATDIARRPGRKRRHLSSTERKILLFQQNGLSRRAATVLATLGCDAPDDALMIEPAELSIYRNCGKVTTAELRAFVEARRLDQTSPLG